MFSLSIYPLTYPFTYLYFHLSTQVKNSLRVVNKGRAEQQKGKIQLNLQVPFHLSTFCCVFTGFTDLFICFWKVQHMHPVKRISFVTPDHDPDDKKIFGYVCSQPDCSTGYTFYALKSENVRN